MRKRNINKNHIITIVSAILVLIGIVVSVYLRGTNKTLTLITTLTAIIGAFAIYMQIRKSKLIGQSSFTMAISQYFYDVPGMTEFVHKLGRATDVDNKEYVVTKKDKTTLIKYLNYLKTMATLVNQNVINIETLNSVFAYEFFIVVNNKSVQKLELTTNNSKYMDIYELYHKWHKYRVKHHLEIMCEESALNTTSEYKKVYSKEVVA